MPPSGLFAFRRRVLLFAGCAVALAAQASKSDCRALRGHVPAAAVDTKPIGALAESNRLQLTLALPARHPAELATLLRALYDPSSPQFHHFLKPPEFTARFGPTEGDYAAVTAFARSNGLRLVRTHANRLLLDVDGSVGNVQKTFHVQMNIFRHPTEARTFFAPDVEPSVKAGLPLLHISGLDNYQLPSPNMASRFRSFPFTASTGSGPGGSFMGRDFRHAYAPGVTLDGAGQIVALVEFDGFYTNDITAYENANSLPQVPITTVALDGFGGTPGEGNGEVSLDIEMSVAMAPGLSQVIVYQAPYGSTSVSDSLLNQIALDDQANQIACCWLFNIDAASDVIFQEMAAQGQSFFAACGDTGAWDVDVPPLESDANITIVGGTSLTTTGPGGTWAAETVWNGFTSGDYFPGAASSGGISVTYPIPIWQQSVNMSSNQGSALWRNVPDVSMVADQVWITFGNGQTEIVGGTSCATPLWAGLTALINQQAAQNGRPPVGFINPGVYGAAQSALYPSIFHDITTGNNTNSNSSLRFFAAPGYDLCTGWGTPQGQALINTLAPPDSLVLAPGGGLGFAVTNGVALGGGSQTLELTNTGNTTVGWALGSVPGWLGISISNGVILANQAAFAALSVNIAATNLPPDGYVADLLVTNLTTGVTHIFPVFLQVSDPLVIAPGSGLAVAGPVGGPFSPLAQNFTLSNTAAMPVNWTAQSTSAYAHLSPAGGTLPPGGATNIAALLDPAAGNLLIAAPSGNLVFTDLNTGNLQTQPFTLAVGNGGFETGDFSDWTFAGLANVNGAGSVLEGFTDYIHTGEYAAFLGQPGDTASLSQTLPTTPGRLYSLSLFLDNPVGGAVNQFVVKWGGATLFNQLNLAQMFWTNMTFTVLATNTATTLEFDFRNDPDAFGLDDISVTPIPAPAFSSVAASNNAIVFQWNTTPGIVYQLQSTTNLAAPSWINTGAPITATNSVISAADSQHPDPQRFYRIQLSLP